MLPKIEEGCLYKIHLKGEFIALAECIEWETLVSSPSGKFRPLILAQGAPSYKGHMIPGLAETIKYTDILLYEYSFEKVSNEDIPLYLHDGRRTRYFEEYLKKL